MAKKKKIPALLSGNALLPQDDAVPLSEVTGMNRYPDVYSVIQPGNYQAMMQPDELRFVLVCDNRVAMELFFAEPTTLRVRYAPKGHFEPDFSYAVSPDYSPKQFTVQTVQTEAHLVFDTGALSCQVQKNGLKIRISDRKGNVVLEDEQGYSHYRSVLKGNYGVRVNFRSANNQRYYGLGDKTAPLDLRGTIQSNWCTDAYGFHTGTRELYRSIPFFLSYRAGISYGVFLDNTWRTHFDFDSRKNGVMQMGADGGELRYYIFLGDNIQEVAKHYASLTGKPELPPLWAFGFHQCRWSYYPDERVRDIASEFRKREIPCDAIYLDIDYMDGFRCFTWDTGHFPDPAKLIEDLAEDGFKTVLMIDPGIKEEEGYWVYDEGVSQEAFCRRASGERMVGPVWPADCVFPDFTHPEVREWWGNLYRHFYKFLNVSGFWNDMNEPAVFQVKHLTFPDDVRHHYEGYPCDHRKAHNVYGMQMARATFEGLTRIRPEQRPFVLARASFSGGQRYGAIWTGDNYSTWEHLRLANLQLQRLSLSGFSFAGTDIGGFAGVPDGELFVRWLQLGVFHPLMRVHTMGNHTDGTSMVDESTIREAEQQHRIDQEPWSYGVHFTDAARLAIALRYTLMPYFYTVFWRHTHSGSPVIRSLCTTFPEDKKCQQTEREFMFGSNLLISPVLAAGETHQDIYFPKGEWYDWWTNLPHHGGKVVSKALRIDQIPLFARAGAVVPTYPVIQHTGQKPEIQPILKIFFKKGHSRSYWYEDAGDGFGYRAGDYCLFQFELEGKDRSLHLRVRREGHFDPPFPSVRLELIGLPFPGKTFLSDGLETEPANEAATAFILPLYIDHFFIGA